MPRSPNRAPAWAERLGWRVFQGMVGAYLVALLALALVLLWRFWLVLPDLAALLQPKGHP